MLKVGPDVEVVTDGRTKVKVLKATSAARAPLTPFALKIATFWRRVLINKAPPTIPFVVIMIAANTVSLAKFTFGLGDPQMSTTIIPTSMTVTANASVREPNGSPTFNAITSA